AKIANHAAKKIRDYNGVCVLDNDRERLQVLAQLNVDEVWGIGRKLSKQMVFMGIETALDLANLPVGITRKNFNVEVERIVRELNGQPCKTGILPEQIRNRFIPLAVSVSVLPS
ncbi:MAG: DNA polymerase V, partial [Moritella dasanensis]